MKLALLIGAILFQPVLYKTLEASDATTHVATTGGFYGDTKIFSIDPNDTYLRADNVSTGTKVLSGLTHGAQIKIVRTLYRNVQKLYRINTSGYSLIVAENQYIYSPYDYYDKDYESESQWKQAKDLKSGDYLYSYTAQGIITVDSIDIYDNDNYAVYHLEMDRDHMFYAGDAGILVHNPNWLKKAVKVIKPVHVIAPVYAMNQAIEKKTDPYISDLIVDNLPAEVRKGMEKVYKPLISAAVEKRMNKAIKSGKFEQSKAYPDQLDNRDKIGQGKKESYCSSRDRRKGTCEDPADNDFFNQTVIEYSAACIAGGAVEGIRGFRAGGLAGALAGAGWGCAGGLAGIAAGKSSEMEDEPGDGRRK